MLHSTNIVAICIATYMRPLLLKNCLHSLTEIIVPEKYTPIICWNDTNESLKSGALLVANHGKGSFIYTGISFFRELPAGVPGAFKLFANIVSYEQ